MNYADSLRLRNKPITGVGVVFSASKKGISARERAELQGIYGKSGLRTKQEIQVFWYGKEEMPDPDLTMSNPGNLGYFLFNVMNPSSEIKDDYKTGIPFLK